MKYKIILSTKNEIPIDEDELQSIVSAIRERKTVKVRQGIFNSSYVVSVIPDIKRIKDYREAYKYDIQEGRMDKEPPLLPDAFDGLN